MKVQVSLKTGNAQSSIVRLVERGTSSPLALAEYPSVSLLTLFLTGEDLRKVPMEGLDFCLHH